MPRLLLLEATKGVRPRYPTASMDDFIGTADYANQLIHTTVEPGEGRGGGQKKSENASSI